MFSNQFDDDEHSKYGMSAPKVKYWMDDSQAPRCMRCSCEFSAIIRRHHCRKCGEIICDDCCKVKLLIPLEEMVFPPEKAVLSAFEQDAAEPQKVCSTCAMDLLPLQTELQRSSRSPRGRSHRPGPGGPAPVLQRALQLLPRGPDQEGKLHAAELHGRKPAGGSRHLAPRTAVGGRGHCHPHIREGRLFFHRAVRHGAGGGPAARGRLERALGRRLQRGGGVSK
ncbi:unnamed protein product [Heterosigma akashiwo]